MQKYHGVLKNAVEVDGFPRTSLPTLYTMHAELLAVRGGVTSSSSHKGSHNCSPAAAQPTDVVLAAAPQKNQRKGAEPVESPEQQAERLLAEMGVEAAQQPVAASNSPFKGTAEEKRVAKQAAHRWAVSTYAEELKKGKGDR